ncbi:MAG: hypothetical protein RLZZ301_745 [Bacteroidota bacterium]
MLGASITREAISQGFAVKAQILPNTSTAVLDGLSIDIVEGNILDTVFLNAEIANCDYVINVAALTTIWPRRLPIIHEVNVQGVKNVVEACKTQQVKRLIQIGTANSFDHGPKSNPGTENSPYKADQFGMDYMDSKYEAQCFLLNEFRQHQFPVIILNPTYMIGPFDSGPTSGRMLMELYNDALPGYAGGGKNFVYSKDVATAAINALTMGREGQCYIVGNENLHFEEMFRKAAKVFNKPFKLKRFPGFAINLVGAIQSLIARLRKKAPQLSYTMAKMASIHQFYSPEKARQEIGLPSTPIEIAIEDCVNWYKENNYLS